MYHSFTNPSNYHEQISYKSVHAYYFDEDKFSVKIFHESANVKIFSKLQKSQFLDKIQRWVIINELFQENPSSKL